tara:strand:- start:541 stop:798 length:258 start_codon:yes stop_codon:yes gene_type:complete
MTDEEILNWWKSKILSHKAMFDLEKEEKGKKDLRNADLFPRTDIYWNADDWDFCYVDINKDGIPDYHPDYISDEVADELGESRNG